MTYIVHHDGISDPATTDEIAAMCAAYDYQQHDVPGSFMETVNDDLP